MIKMGNEDGTEESGTEESGTEESGTEEEEVDDVEEESETETETEEKPIKDGKDVKDKPDPLVIDYAESLKKSLGKQYDPELDKLGIRERITIMKHLSAMRSKMRAETKKSAKARIPKPKANAKQHGRSFKTLGKKYQ